MTRTRSHQAQAQSQQAQAQWLEHRLPHWRRLERHLAEQRDSRREEPSEALELLELFRGLARDVALARGVAPGGRITRYLETLLIRAHEIVYRRPHRFWQELTGLYRDEVPALMQRLGGAIAATTALFILCIMAGWLLVHANPELATLFASPKMIDQVQAGKLWTDDLLNILPSALLAFSIVTNNVTVTLFAFALGTFYGLGTLYIIALNGLMLGGVFAFTGHYGLDGRLFEFVVAHGVVELSVICLAGAAGIQLGEALVRPGSRSRRAAFQDAVAQAGKLLTACIPFLIGAGIIEGYVSPDPVFSLPVRIGLGVGYGVLFWLTLFGKVGFRRKNPFNADAGNYTKL